jgi:uncharacterized protein YdhG (YjbR/CyaY superfamily)
MTNRIAKTPAQYIASLPPERRAAIRRLRQLIRKNLPTGYREQVGFGMLMYSVPLSVLPDTYNGQPLCYAALAVQKRHTALYLMTAYGQGEIADMLHEGFRKAGKKLDMGKCCIRFQSPDDLPLDVIGRVVACVPMKKYVEIYRASRRRT